MYLRDGTVNRVFLRRDGTVYIYISSPLDGTISTIFTTGRDDTRTISRFNRTVIHVFRTGRDDGPKQMTAGRDGMFQRCMILSAGRNDGTNFDGGLTVPFHPAVTSNTVPRNYRNKP